MKLKKSGYYRNKGFTTLVDTLSFPKRHVIRVLKWHLENWHLFLRIKGEDGSSTYDYDLTLSADELANLVETALMQGSKDVSVQAGGKAMGAYIREALSEKNRLPVPAK